jgi:hypothetical protein
MKKISAALLGLSLTLATAGLSLAAQAPTDNSTPATTTKKHVKKNKKAAAKTDAAKPATPATPAAK